MATPMESSADLPRDCSVVWRRIRRCRTVSASSSEKNKLISLSLIIGKKI
jgi:hypothetical protein